MHEYLAISNERELKKGVSDSRNRGEVVVELRRDQLYPVYIREKKDKKRLLNFNSKLKSKDLLSFNNSFYMLLNTGLSDTESIRILYQTAKNTLIKRKCQNLYSHIVMGDFIYQGLRKERFPELMVTSINAGEENGTLIHILESMSGHYEREKAIEDKLKQAMLYPVILTIIIVGVFIIASFYVISSFEEIFYDFGVQPPLAMQITINIANFVKAYWLRMGLGMLLFTAASYLAMKIQVLRFYIQSIQLHIPVIKGILQKIYVSRFARILSILLAGDAFLVDALKIAATAIQNKVYEKSILRIVYEIEQGNSFESAMHAEKLFPLYLVSLLEISGEAGDYRIMLERGGEIYDREANDAIHRLILILEPTVLIVIGLIVLFMAFAVMMPMYDILDSIEV